MCIKRGVGEETGCLGEEKNHGVLQETEIFRSSLEGGSSSWVEGRLAGGTGRCAYLVRVQLGGEGEGERGRATTANRSLILRPPPAFFDFIKQAIKAGG